MAAEVETGQGTLAELYALADELQLALNALLDRSAIEYNDINRGSSGVFVMGWNPYRWQELDGPGQRELGRARDLTASWRELAGKAIEASAAERAKGFERQGTTIDRVLRFSDGSSDGAPASTIDGVRAKVAEALAKQKGVLADLPSAHGDGGRLLVPDTNALLYQPAIERWEPENGPWTAVIVPQVVRELDQLKMGERPVAEAAATFIRQLKEYGGRGDTFSGVPLARGNQLREVAVDADMTNTLSWLRADHADDRLLASVLELKWRDLTADVVLVTRDRNLQNKVRLARVSFLDVEDLAEPRVTRARVQPAPEAKADEEARSRLAGAMPFAQSKLGVPPASLATSADEQSWTVQATPLQLSDGFAGQVLGSEGPAWFVEHVGTIFSEPVPVSHPPPAPEASARGFSVRRKLLVPRKGALLLVADAGGLVGARYSTELDSDERRALLLRAVEGDYLQPLVQACADGLTRLGASGRTLFEAWAIGLARFQLLTAGHVELSGERDGLLDAGVHHMGGELDIPASSDDVADLVQRWGRELARAAGIPAWET
jgi:hypothetical protein